MGLITMSGNIPTLDEAKIGKNYLTAEELHFLENIADQWMLFCEAQAMRGKKMTMEELSTRLNMMLMANDYPVLYEYNGYKRGQADRHAQQELEKYKRLQPPDIRKQIGSTRKWSPFQRFRRSDPDSN